MRRRDRQRQLLNNKTGKSSPSALGVLGLLGAVIIGLLIHSSAGFLLYIAVHASQRYEAESQGKKIVVSSFAIQGSVQHYGAFTVKQFPAS